MQETMSAVELRRCYGRSMLCIFLGIILTALMGGVISGVYYWFLEPILLMQGVAVDDNVVLIVMNDLISYLPLLIVIPAVMGANPRVPREPARPLPRRELAIAIPFCIGVLYLFAYLTDGLVAGLEWITGMETGNALDTLDDLPTGLYVLSVVVIGPICEEFLIRKLFLDRCRVLGDVSAILLSAAVFGLMHENLYQMFYAFAVGVCLGSVAILTGRIRECILIHMCVNGVSALALWEPGGAWTLAWQSVIMVGIFACMAYAIYLFCKRVGHYHFSPGPLPFTAAEKRRACFSSPCFWICGGLCVLESIVSIFFL